MYILNLIDDFNKFKSKQKDMYDISIRELKDKIESQQTTIGKISESFSRQTADLRHKLH